MYAVIETGGKQYKVSEGDVIRVEKLPQEQDEAVEFERVLMVGNDDEVKIGTPTVDGVTVKGKVKGSGKGDKVIIFKYKSKKNYRRKQGHRQPYTEVLIEKIEV